MMMTIDQQMPQVLRIFVDALSQGWSVMQIFQHIHAQTTPPLSEAMQGFLDAVAAGTAFPLALQQMAEASQSKRLGQMVAVIEVQLAEGGNLAERFAQLDEAWARESDLMPWHSAIL